MHKISVYYSTNSLSLKVLVRAFHTMFTHTHRHEGLLLRVCRSAVPALDVLVVVQVLPSVLGDAVFGFHLKCVWGGGEG